MRAGHGACEAIQAMWSTADRNQLVQLILQSGNAASTQALSGLLRAAGLDPNRYSLSPDQNAITRAINIVGDLWERDPSDGLLERLIKPLRMQLSEVPQAVEQLDKLAQLSGGTQDGAASSGGSGGSGTRGESPVCAPKIEVVKPTPPADPTLSDEEKDRLISILANTNFMFEAQQRRTFFEQTRLSSKWFLNLIAGNDVYSIAENVVQDALRLGRPIGGEPKGYTVLGAILNRLVQTDQIGQSDGYFVASLISRYKLIDLDDPGVAVAPLLRKLLQLQPVFPQVGEATKSIFEKAIVGREDLYLEMGIWTEKLVRIIRQICRITVPVPGNKASYGTGFLVGPDLLLTNYHVIQDLLPEKGATANPQNVLIEFDYIRWRIGQQPGPVSPYRLKPGTQADWLIDKSPYSPQDWAVPPGLPADNELDYALLRLESTAADEKINGSPRGWVERPQQEHVFEERESLYIIGHPLLKLHDDPAGTAPLKGVLAKDSVIGVNANGTRVTYETATEHGSSGSPCFTEQWELVAMHHAEVLGQNANSGIPIWRVITQPKVQAALAK